MAESEILKMEEGHQNIKIVDSLFVIMPTHFLEMEIRDMKQI